MLCWFRFPLSRDVRERWFRTLYSPPATDAAVGFESVSGGRRATRQSPSSIASRSSGLRPPRRRFPARPRSTAIAPETAARRAAPRNRTRRTAAAKPRRDSSPRGRRVLVADGRARRGGRRVEDVFHGRRDLGAPRVEAAPRLRRRGEDAAVERLPREAGRVVDLRAKKPALGDFAERRGRPRETTRRQPRVSSKPEACVFPARREGTSRVTAASSYAAMVAPPRFKAADAASKRGFSGPPATTSTSR